jgi:hypothetical protein
MHAHQTGSSPEQIAPSSAELSRAAAGQDEAKRFLVLHEAVNLVEQIGHLLDLVQDHDPAASFQGPGAVPDENGSCRQRSKRLGVEEAEEQGIGRRGPQERGLAGFAGPKEEEAAGRGHGGEVEVAPVHGRRPAQDCGEIQWRLHQIS